VAAYRNWSDQMPAEIEVCAIQLPGRDDRMREKLFHEMAALVEELARGLAPSLDIPYAFFGHSMGALIAYELLGLLRRQSQPNAAHLFVSARRAPQIANTDPPIHQLPERDFVAQIVKRYNGIPPVILAEPELMQLFLPIMRADFALLETYSWQPGELLNHPITAFGGLQDRLLTRADLCSWKELTRGSFGIHMLPGGHFFLQENQAELVRLIAQQLIT
jgi:medium-chain acyl-[acyl-carrier-protein] hydrolase